MLTAKVSAANSIAEQDGGVSAILVTFVFLSFLESFVAYAISVYTHQKLSLSSKCVCCIPGYYLLQSSDICLMSMLLYPVKIMYVREAIVSVISRFLRANE